MELCRRPRPLPYITSKDAELRALFLLSLPMETEACFQKVIEIAQRQQAKSLERGAVMSLVRLRQQEITRGESRDTRHESRTRLAEAHQMLSEIYGWFTEGFDTKDLREAKTLLEELN